MVSRALKYVLTALWALWFVSFAFAFAQQVPGPQAGTVSQMPFASTPFNGSELLYIIQNGYSRKTNVSALLSTLYPNPYISVINASPPDTITGGFYLTSDGVTGNITAAVSGGQPTPPPGFAARDVNKLITCTGLGMTGVDQANYAGVITAVTDSQHITVSPTPTLSMTAAYQKCAYGTDQSVNLQGAFNSGTTTGLGSNVPAGVYLVSQPLTCLPPPQQYNITFQYAMPPLCNGQGATIIAMAPMTTLMTYGSTSYYTGNIYTGYVFGITFNCNFLADYCVDFPQGVNTTVTIQAENQNLAGIRVGNYNAGTVYDGLLIVNSKFHKDYYTAPVASLTTGSTTSICTTLDNGYTTGRSVTFSFGTSPTQLFNQSFQITVTSARCFTLNNTNSTGWASLSSGTAVTENYPNTPFPINITAITTGATTTVTTAVPHSYVNGENVCIYNVSGNSQIDGCYTTASVTSTTFVLSGVTSSGSAFPSNGVGTNPFSYVIAQPIPDVHSSPAAASILYENSGDAYEDGNTGDGGVWGSYSGTFPVGSPRGGYDGTYIGDHWFNRPPQGIMYAGYVVYSHTRFESDHTDCPALFSFQVLALQNDIKSPELDCAGFPSLANNETSLIRIEPNASATRFGGQIVAASGQNVVAPVSSAGTATGATVGAGSLYGTIPGYTQIGVRSTDEAYVTYPQPDTLLNSLYINALTSAASMQAIGTNGTQIQACDRTTNAVGAYIYAGDTGSGIAQSNSACAFVTGEFFFNSSGYIQAQQPFAPPGPYSAAGTVIPACGTSLKGYMAWVSDATARSSTYTSGGTVVDSVFCNGASWLTQ